MNEQQTKPPDPVELTQLIARWQRLHRRIDSLYQEEAELKSQFYRYAKLIPNTYASIVAELPYDQRKCLPVPRREVP